MMTISRFFRVIIFSCSSVSDGAVVSPPSCCVIKKKKNPIKNNFNYANIHQRNRIKNDMLYYKAVVLSLTPLLFYLPSQVVNGN